MDFDCEPSGSRLPSQEPPFGAAAVELQGELWPTGPPANQLASPPAPDDFDQHWSDNFVE